MHVYNNDNNAGIDDVNNDENIALKRCFCFVGYCEVNHGKYVSMNIHALFPVIIWLKLSLYCIFREDPKSSYILEYILLLWDI